MMTYLPSDTELNTFLIIAKNAAASGLYASLGSEQKILMIILAARELNIPIFQALNGGLWNIQGKIEISARLMNAMIRRAGHSIKVLECNPQSCILEGKRADTADTCTAQFKIEDAIKAGLSNRPIWKSYAEDMLYSRAMSRLARRLFSDVIGTAYVEGEIQDSHPENGPLVATHEKAADTAIAEEELQSQFCASFPEENPELLGMYIKRYAEHWKKSIADSLADYQDTEKFLCDFGKWKIKQERR